MCILITCIYLLLLQLVLRVVLSSLGQDNGGGSGRFKQGIVCIKLFFSCHAWKGSLFTVELVSRFLLHNSVF